MPRGCDAGSVLPKKEPDDEHEKPSPSRYDCQSDVDDKFDERGVSHLEEFLHGFLLGVDGTSIKHPENIAQKA